MYCLDCGCRLAKDETSCPQCGLSLAAMEERLAEAVERLSYTDAVVSEQTNKLPLVAKRTYTDGHGNPLDPSKEVEPKNVIYDAAGSDLQAIPEIGKQDPYVTVPMQRIVSSSGEVVADVDRDTKEYRQQPPKKTSKLKIVGVVIALLFLLACMLYTNIATWLSVIFG